MTSEEINLIKTVVGDYVCTLKMEIDQQRQTFKGYEHCSNIMGLEGELLDAEHALSILVKTQSNCNGFCGEYECKENKEGCKRNEH